MKCLSVLLIAIFAASVSGQSYIVDIQRESARSDKVTGGRIERKILEPGNPNIRITINLPAFQMTLWQDGKEVKSYPIGIGLLEFPVRVGPLQATSIEWNPVWIPPSSDWIEKSITVKAGEIVLPTDPRNPLGKVKIPLGYGYLIHQAKGPGDMGSLVSHGCIRVMQPDLYDLSEKIVAARSLDVTSAEIATAKRNKRTLVAPLEPAVVVEITYDTIVVEGGVLHIYPDVYRYNKNTAAELRKEFRTNGVNESAIPNNVLVKMIAAAKGRNQYVIGLAGLRASNIARTGKIVPVVSTPQKR